MTLADTALTLPPALEFLDAVLVSFPGSLTAPMTLSIPRPPQVTDASRVLVLRTQEIGGRTRLVLVAVGRILATQIVSDTSLNGIPGAFDGLTLQGRYLFVRANTDVGFSTGTVTGITSAPFAGALVSSSNLSVVALSRQTALHRSRRNRRLHADCARPSARRQRHGDRHAGECGRRHSTQSAVERVGARVVSITPGDGTTNVPLTNPIIVTFSKRSIRPP